jgi:hypothetical protein
MAFTDYFWSPPFTGSVIVEAWGSGAGGYLGGYGAGGGGAYARTSGIAVVAAVIRTVRVGDGGSPNNNGDDSVFFPFADPVAKGGNTSILGAGGLGGTAAASTGDVKYSGGDGSVSTGGLTIGGGGGGSAGDSADGVAGSSPSGAFAIARGGRGGDGGTGGSDGTNGGTPGGGAGASGTLGASGGTGGNGAVVIWEDLGVWPPIGQIPLASFGNPPPNTYSYGDIAYVSPANQTVIAECWGGGSQGRIGQGPNTPGCGGGGGAYARKAGIALIAGGTYLVRVGAPKHIAAAHESLFINGGVVLADGAVEAVFHGPGIGGQAASSVGDVKFSGGSGAPYPGDIASDGGGGASSAGRSSAGNDGSFPAPGATIVDGGGPGAFGGLQPDGNGVSVTTGPGGGGGGGSTGTVQTNPGFGFQGAVVLWLDGGVWPPVGSPVASFGAPPPLPTPPTPGVKYRKTGNCM